MKFAVIHWYKPLALCLTLGFIFSCGSQEQNADLEESEKPVEESNGTALLTDDETELIPEPGFESNDSIYLSGSYILFFGPSDNEIRLQLEEGTVPPGYNELIDASDKLSKQMLDTLRSINYPVKHSYSEASIVCITMQEGNRMYFNRRNLKFPAGMIMMDGMQPPAIRSSNSTIQDYIRYVKEYFVNIDFPEPVNEATEDPNA